MNDKVNVEYQQPTPSGELAMTAAELLKDENWAVCYYHNGEYGFFMDAYYSKDNAKKRAADLQAAGSDYRVVRIIHQ